MESYTAKTANLRANELKDSARNLFEYKEACYEQLSHEERERINADITDLLNLSDRLFILSATLVMNDDTLHALDSLRDTTKALNNSCKNMESVQKVINIAGKVITLAVSLFASKEK